MPIGELEATAACQAATLSVRSSGMALSRGFGCVGLVLASAGRDRMLHDQHKRIHQPAPSRVARVDADGVREPG